MSARDDRERVCVGRRVEWCVRSCWMDLIVCRVVILMGVMAVGYYSCCLI